MKTIIFRVYYSIYIFFCMIGRILGRPFIRLVGYIAFIIVICIPYVNKIAVKNHGTLKNVLQDVRHPSYDSLFNIHNGNIVNIARKAFEVLLLVAILDIMIFFVAVFDIHFLYKGFGILYCVIFSYLLFVVIEYTYPPFKDFYGYIKCFKEFSKAKSTVTYKWNVISLLLMSVVLFVCYCEIRLLIKMANDNMSSYEAIRYVMNKYL